MSLFKQEKQVDNIAQVEMTISLHAIALHVIAQQVIGRARSVIELHPAGTYR